MTTEEACEFLVRQVEAHGSELYEDVIVKDGRIAASVYVFVGPCAKEMTAMIREYLGKYGFKRDR